MVGPQRLMVGPVPHCSYATGYSVLNIKLVVLKIQDMSTHVRIVTKCTKYSEWQARLVSCVCVCVCVFGCMRVCVCVFAPGAITNYSREMKPE